MIYEFDKHYTVEEANALIPWVRKLFAELHLILWPDKDVPPPPDVGNGHSNGNGNGNVNGNGHGHNGSNGGSAVFPMDYGAIPIPERRDASERLIAALTEKGIVIQDVAKGLIDFPALRNDREIFLCYQLSDGDSIGWYHDLNAGFAGRQRLEKDL